MDLTPFIRDVPDFPKPGIIFKGITSVVAIESRGFIFGTGVARVLNAALVPVRKPGKLPWKTRTHEYTLEYGSGALEIHDDALTPNDRALIIDDVLATGGTAAAAACLVRDLGAEIAGVGMVIELSFLHGREKLDVPVHALLRY
jgi:adenine phosphoribosyltransferase